MLKWSRHDEIAQPNQCPDSGRLPLDNELLNPTISNPVWNSARFHARWSPLRHFLHKKQMPADPPKQQNEIAIESFFCDTLSL